MLSGKVSAVCLLISIFLMNTVLAGDKPLKIFIMAGQSNMQGQAQVRTIERLKFSEDSKAMYNDMMGKDGMPAAPEGVYSVYFTGGDMKFGQKRELNIRKGPMKPGYDNPAVPTDSIGPDYTFGIYMKKHLDQPILIIKTAWGGRDLKQQFRPPSAGPYKTDKCKHGLPTGAYYKLMLENVQMVLKDPGQYHPQYSKEAGYEIGGFVWFQGYNDLISDFSEYDKLMACLIRDVRKDLNIPALPVVIGVMGIDGVIENKNDKQYKFREAQAAAASLPEFAGTVSAVRTEAFWDTELQKIKGKLDEAVKKKILAENPKLTGKSLQKAIDSASQSMAAEILTPEELSIVQNGTSDQSYHYLGSAYTYGKIGKAFADSMAEMLKKK